MTALYRCYGPAPFGWRCRLGWHTTVLRCEFEPCWWNLRARAKRWGRERTLW